MKVFKKGDLVRRKGTPHVGRIVGRRTDGQFVVAWNEGDANLLEVLPDWALSEAKAWPTD